MNTYDMSDEGFVNSKAFQEFMKQHPGRGFLRIRAYAASGAIPVRGLKVVVSTKIQNNNFIFFEGYTNESGIIDNISLPASRLETNNLDVPERVVYDIRATYLPNDVNLLYQVNIYENVFVIQNINIVPELNLKTGDA